MTKPNVDSMTFQTFGLGEAANFLRCGEDTLRQLAASGEVPGAKVGREWVFVDVDLVDWLRTQYGQRNEGRQPCQTSKSAETSTIPISRSKARGLDELLKLPTRRKPRSDATNSEHLSGKKPKNHNVTRSYHTLICTPDRKPNISRFST